MRAHNSMWNLNRLWSICNAVLSRVGYDNINRSMRKKKMRISVLNWSLMYNFKGAFIQYTRTL